MAEGTHDIGPRMDAVVLPDMSWILIVVLWSGPFSVTMERFPNQGSCEAAKAWIQSKGAFSAVCLEDSKK